MRNIVAVQYTVVSIAGHPYRTGLWSISQWVKDYYLEYLSQLEEIRKKLNIPIEKIISRKEKEIEEPHPIQDTIEVDKSKIFDRFAKAGQLC